MKKLMSYVGFIGLVAVASANVMAEEGHWYLGGSAASYYLDSDRDVTGGDLESVVGGLQAGYMNSGGTAFELAYQEDVGGDDLEVITFSWLKMLSEEGGLRPYLTAGVSHFDLDSSDPGIEEDATVQIHLGLGLSNMLNDNWEVRGDVRALKDMADNYIDAAVTLAVNYHFVEAKMAPAPEPAPEPMAKPEMRTITIRLNVEFEFDKDVVLAIYGDEIEAITNAMKVHDDIILVLLGHTDSRGSEDYNQDLSSRRAAAVKAKLVADYGISASRVSTVGYGESRPIADNDTDEGRAHNRRVVGEMTYSEVM